METVFFSSPCVVVEAVLDFRLPAKATRYRLVPRRKGAVQHCSVSTPQTCRQGTLICQTRISTLSSEVTRWFLQNLQQGGCYRACSTPVALATETRGASFCAIRQAHVWRALWRNTSGFAQAAVVRRQLAGRCNSWAERPGVRAQASFLDSREGPYQFDTRRE